MSAQSVVSVTLPEPVPVGGHMLLAATVMLVADPDDLDSDIWFGKVRSIDQQHDRLDVRFVSGEVATVLVSKAHVAVLNEADPDEAFAFWYEDAWPTLGKTE